MYNFVIDITFYSGISSSSFLAEIWLFHEKKLAFQNQNLRGCHFGTSCHNLPKFSVNLPYT